MTFEQQCLLVGTLLLGMDGYYNGPAPWAHGRSNQWVGTRLLMYCWKVENGLVVP